MRLGPATRDLSVLAAVRRGRNFLRDRRWKKTLFTISPTREPSNRELFFGVADEAGNPPPVPSLVPLTPGGSQRNTSAVELGSVGSPSAVSRCPSVLGPESGFPRPIRNTGLGLASAPWFEASAAGLLARPLSVSAQRARPVLALSPKSGADHRTSAWNGRRSTTDRDEGFRSSARSVLVQAADRPPGAPRPPRQEIYRRTIRWGYQCVIPRGTNVSYRTRTFIHMA